MPACTYIPDSEAATMLATGDADLDELLTAANKIDGDRWRVGRRTCHQRKRWFRKRPEPTVDFTLYWYIDGIEYQVVNFHTPNGGSVFHGSPNSKSDICNYLMGYVQGRRERRSEG